MSIFEVQAKKLKRAEKAYGNQPYWFIMTSKDNDVETKAFFEENDYFGLDKAKVIFFIQGEIPLTYENGEEDKDSEGNTVNAANGNGGIFKALEDEGILELMQKEGIDYICSCNVDNILVNPIDEIAVGSLEENHTELGIKTTKKAFAEEKVGNVVTKDGATSVIEYIDFPQELASQTDENGELRFTESHFGCNYISLELLERIADQKLPIHEAHKHNDEYGDYIKREMFIFDGFEMAKSSLVFRVKREDEFSPIKNKEGVDSPLTAVQLYENSELVNLD
jgi:UDP-N-acetylglucosamine/UDP-N-acetylgalactosamine diphosphorylase